MERQAVRFQGFDWSELASTLGLNYTSYSNDKRALAAFKRALTKASFAHMGAGDAKIANNVRRFLASLGKHNTHDGPFFRGLQNIEHDGLMLRLVAHNLEFLWL